MSTILTWLQVICWQGRLECHWVSCDTQVSRYLVLQSPLSTVLSSAGNDGRVRLWKATVGNIFRAAGHISVEQAEEQTDTDVDMDETLLE